MSKLIGTDPNQVPSNADLGTAAYMDAKDFLTSRGSSLSAIDSILNNNLTVKAVKVYDTSKDSDGGAWRKRTQHTSWYNEELNTHIRGSRREFPSVAVIVAYNQDVIIYDADDPLLPMWMSFPYDEDIPAGQQIIHPSVSRYWGAVTAMNGIIAVGQTRNTTVGMGVDFVNFPADKGYRIRNAGSSNYRGWFNGNIAQRRYPVTQFHYDGKVLGSLNDGTISSIDATVVPGSYVDPMTNLPVPTFAIGTEYGINIVHSDVYVNGDNAITHLYHGSTAHMFTGEVRFDSLNRIVYTWDVSGDKRRLYVTDYLDNGSDWNTADTSSYPSSWTRGYGSFEDSLIEGNYDGNMIGPTTYGIKCMDTMDDRQIAAGCVDGVTLVQAQYGRDSRDSLMAYISKDYNTGWMYGDVRAAMLNEIDDGTKYISASAELLDQNLSNWTLSGATLDTSVYLSSPSSIKSTNSGQIGYSNYFTVEAGKYYLFSFRLYDASPASNHHGEFDIYDGDGTLILHTWAGPTSQGSGWQHHQRLFRSVNSGSSARVRVLADDSDETVYFDNLSVKEVTLLNKSPWNDYEGYNIVGSLKREPVAPGSDIVGYSGFDANNYLESHSYRASVGQGSTDSFSLSFWINFINDSYGTYQGIYTGGNPGTYYQMRGINVFPNSTEIQWDFYGGSGCRYTFNNFDTWYHVVGVVDHNASSSSRLKFYINGKLEAYSALPSTLVATSNDGAFVNRIGNHCASLKLSLFKIFDSVPSAEDVRKMYADEKNLFKDNAKAGIYGDHNTVNAIDYDEGTDILHVGTSSGRSMFRRLERIDNTTDGVTIDISAHNGLVVED